MDLILRLQGAQQCEDQRTPGLLSWEQPWHLLRGKLDDGHRKVNAYQSESEESEIASSSVSHFTDQKTDWERSITGSRWL